MDTWKVPLAAKMMNVVEDAYCTLYGHARLGRPGVREQDYSIRRPATEVTVSGLYYTGG